jgi:hypothetical protein
MPRRRPESPRRRRDDFPLPALASKLRTLRTSIKEGIGVGYVRGIPVARYDRETQLRIYWGISCHIGEPVPYCERRQQAPDPEHGRVRLSLQDLVIPVDPDGRAFS